MIQGIPKISVLIITYKQENLINRALDSLIKQKAFLYEICVSDDCSPDGTWDVLLDYQKRYPDLIKLHHNDCNLGIFENFEQVFKMPSGEVINMMAGDDEAGANYFEHVISFIREKGIDYKNELFCIYSDYEAVYPNGDSMVFSNSSIINNSDKALRLALRGIIGGRGCCFSINVLKRFDYVSQGRSHKVEHVQDRQIQLNTENSYYIPCVGNIYYTNIGVSANINEDIRKERLQIWPFTIEYLKQKGVPICKSDINYGKYNVALQIFRFNHSIVNFLNVVKTFVLSRDFSLPDGNYLRHFYFAIRRRIPHKKPLHI